jgi:Uma2 family endonuclease
MAETARIARRGSLTYRDLWHTPDDGNRWEIIDGEVFVSPAPYVSHQVAVFNLATLLRTHVIAGRLGRIFIAPIAVIPDTPSGVQPDIVYVAHARRAIVQEKGICGAPDLVIEVLSSATSSRDRGVKKDLYARSDVRHYWLVDPRKRGLVALRLEGGAYVREAECGPRGVFRPTLFPGLTLRMRDVFAVR